MSREDAKATVRAQLRAKFESICLQNEQALQESVAAGDLDVHQAAEDLETMRAANLAELRRAEACSDRLIDTLAGIDACGGGAGR